MVLTASTCRQFHLIEVGVYVCGFKISGMKTDEQDIETITIEPPTIVKLDVEIRGRRKLAG